MYFIGGEPQGLTTFRLTMVAKFDLMAKFGHHCRMNPLLMDFLRYSCMVSTLKLNVRVKVLPTPIATPMSVLCFCIHHDLDAYSFNISILTRFAEKETVDM
jgi:hypothetical protein